MFKKTLIAAAVVATTASFGAAAATVAVAPETVGVEYAAGITQLATTNDVTVTTGRDFASGDIISVTYTGATVATMTNASTPAAIVPTVTSTSGNVEFLEYDGNSVKLLVTDASLLGDAITVSGVQLIVGSAADKGLVKVSSVGKVATVEGAKVVDAGAPVTYITFADELKTAITTKFSKVVDVEAARKKFTDGTTTDTLVLSNTIATVDRGVVVDGASYKVYGDFSFLDENGDGDLADAKDGSITSTGGVVTVADDMMSATVADANGTSTTGTVGVTVSGPTGVVIPNQEFMAEASISYENPALSTASLTDNTLSKSAAGAWTLNGAQAFIPFLPFGSQYSQSVTISNTSNQTGGVDLVLYVGEDKVEVEGVATIVAEGVTDISAAVRNAVAEAGISSGNVAIEIIVNAPKDDIEVTAVYYSKADGDRLRTK